MSREDPEGAIDTLTWLGTEGQIDGFVFWPPYHAIGQIERFANEVVPAVRGRISARLAEHSS